MPRLMIGGCRWLSLFWEVVMRVMFLSASVGALVAYALASPAAAQSRFYSFERGIDRPGLDYRNAPSRGPADCSFACQAEGNTCRAWTYVRPGIQGPTGRCWFKTAAPAPTRNGCCTSGVRTSGFPQRID
jgi:hypothetical protein